MSDFDYGEGTGCDASFLEASITTRRLEGTRATKVGAIDKYTAAVVLQSLVMIETSY